MTNIEKKKKKKNKTFSPTSRLSKYLCSSCSARNLLEYLVIVPAAKMRLSFVLNSASMTRRPSNTKPARAIAKLLD